MNGYDEAVKLDKQINELVGRDVEFGNLIQLQEALKFLRTIKTTCNILEAHAEHRMMAAMTPETTAVRRRK